MIDFSNVKKIIIPEGEVKKIENSSGILWEKSGNIFDLSKIDFTGNVYKTSNSITFDNSEIKNSSYFNSENANILNLKPNTIYSTKAKITHEVIQSGGSTSGSMKGCIWLQNVANYSYDTKYAVVGKTYATTEIVYNKFTTPNDLTGYDYLVTRVDGYSKTTFEDIVIVEGDYNQDNFPN